MPMVRFLRRVDDRVLGQYQGHVFKAVFCCLGAVAGASLGLFFWLFSGGSIKDVGAGAIIGTSVGAAVLLLTLLAGSLSRLGRRHR